MLEWLMVSNDGLLLARWSLIQTWMLFFIVFMAINWGVFILVNRFIKQKNTIAINLGFKDFAELRFFFVRDATFAACNFLMFLITVYTFVYQADVIANYNCASLVESQKLCTERNGFLLCTSFGQFNYSEIKSNVSILSNFSINSSGIDQSSYPQYR